MQLRTKQRSLVARFLIGLVIIVNLQCALLFIINPVGFAPMYELIGIPGSAAIQGYGVLFLMWNIPYSVALINPAKFHISLYEAIIMQSIGLVGESIIYYNLPSNYTVLRNSILRFIIFDAAGLVALAIAAWIVHPIVISYKQPKL
jgi:hypothetical protein